MNLKILMIPVFVLGILFVAQIPDSLGHGLGSETMSPEMIDDKEATLEVNSSTIYTDVDGEEKGIKQISINFFESFTNIDSNKVESINNVTFQVELIKGGIVLINETFQRDDGVLIMNLTPSDDEQVKSWNVLQLHRFWDWQVNSIISKEKFSRMEDCMNLKFQL